MTKLLVDFPDDIDHEVLGIFIEAVVGERFRAHRKHGHTSMEQQPLLAHKRASVLMEEAAEAGKALNDHDNPNSDVDLADGRLYSDAHARCDDLDVEHIQTAAMAYTWFANRRGDVLPAIPKPVPLHPDLEYILRELEDRDSSTQNALGDVDLEQRAQRVREWLGSS